LKPWVARTELPRVITAGTKGIPKGAQIEALGCEERATQGDRARDEGHPEGSPSLSPGLRGTSYPG
jgi:hypothetical protein